MKIIDFHWPLPCMLLKTRRGKEKRETNWRDGIGKTATAEHTVDTVENFCHKSYLGHFLWFRDFEILLFFQDFEAKFRQSLGKKSWNHKK